MNHYKNIVSIFTVLLIAFSISSCSKDDSGDDFTNPTGNAGISMKIDGVPWSANISNLFTEEHEDSEIGEYYLVLVGGQNLNFEVEGDVTAIGIHIIVPKSKFNNPKGIYTIVKESEAGLNQAVGSFSQSINETTIYYTSSNPLNPEQSVGTIEITDFEVGEQTIMGQATGEIGYTKLSGNFKLDVYPVINTDLPSVKITEGKFNLKSGIGL